MTDKEIMLALGGHIAVAKELGIPRETALHFVHRAIPWKYRPRIEKMAKRRRIKVPPDFLEVQRYDGFNS